MIEKINPTNINNIENRNKTASVKNADASSEISDSDNQVSQNSVQSSLKNRKYSSLYLKARDVQANISYMQARSDALREVSGKLSQLKNYAIQYNAAKERSLAEQDSIVAGAEQTLYAIDKMASGSQFLGSAVIADADTRELGLEVVNFESGDALAQINAAIKSVTAKMAANNSQNIASDIRLENLRKYSSASLQIDEYQAEQIAESIANAMSSTSAEEVYGGLDGSKVSGLIGI